jgi:branched-chain amino acid transport system permease protein
VRVVNLAHGDLVILGSYLSFATLSIFNVSPLLTLILVIPAMFLIGFIIQYCLVNRVVGQGMNPPLLIAFGLSIILQNLVLLIFTPDARALLTSISIATLPIGDFLNVPVVYLVDFIGALLTIFLLSRFFNKTYLGKAIRRRRMRRRSTAHGDQHEKIYAWAIHTGGRRPLLGGRDDIHLYPTRGGLSHHCSGVVIIGAQASSEPSWEA